jgi:hypothetical protein
MENIIMFKSSLSLKIAALALLASNVCVLHSMEVEEEQTGSQAKYIALYEAIVKQQQERPGHGYDGDLLYEQLMQSLQNVNKNNEGLGSVYQRMWALEPAVFSVLFSPHNIQMLAYEQNEFGNGSPYMFKEFGGSNPYRYGVEGNPVFTSTADKPFLAEYYGPDKGKVTLVTKYSYFFGMLNNLEVSAKSILATHQGNAMATHQGNAMANLVANAAMLQENLVKAKRHYSDLSAHTIGQIAEIVTKRGDMTFLHAINAMPGFAYHLNESEDSSDNVGPVVSRMLKLDWTDLPPDELALINKKTAQTAAQPPFVPLTAAQKPTTIVPSTLWRKIAAATGIAAVTGAIGAWYYNYAKTSAAPK